MKVLIALSMIALAVAGCTGDNSDFVVPDQNDAGEYVVKMTAANTFVPANFEVPAGSTVSFEHVGGSHNVASRDDLWTTGQVGADFKISITTEMIGDNEYFCVPHDALGMNGIMRVTA